MNKIIDIRNKIREYFESNENCQAFFLADPQAEKYAGYYTSMYLIQDTAESLDAHRIKDFSSCPFQAYIEFWGVMQALIIQQDSISELYEAVTSKSLDINKLTFWKEIRKLRNVCAGHPARKDRPKTDPMSRTFLGRNFGGYSLISYEQWIKGGTQQFVKVELGKLIDNYAIDAKIALVEIFDFFEKQWP